MEKVVDAGAVFAFGEILLEIVATKYQCSTEHILAQAKHKDRREARQDIAVILKSTVAQHATERELRAALTRTIRERNRTCLPKNLP